MLKNENVTEAEYELCERIWREKDMHTMRDFLVWYNNLDVGPFLEAVEKMAAFYSERGLDMFKCAISVPGLSLRYLFQTLDKGTFFSLIDRANQDLYYKIKKNVVGGPSIVFNRYHEADKTRIRGGDKMCKKIVGFDANALYLWALMEDMPTGHFTRRKAASQFKPVRSQKHGVMAAEWLDWVAQSIGAHIVHKFNGSEKRVGLRKIPVDGFCQETNTVYQFHGCWYHGHKCHLNQNDYNEIRKTSCSELRKKTEEMSTYIRSQGLNLVELWECEWLKMKKGNPHLQEFLASIRLPHHNRTTMTQAEVLQFIADGTMFGLVECDVRVPPALTETLAEKREGL